MTNTLAATAIPTVFLPYALSLRRTPRRERHFWWMLTLAGLLASGLFALVAFTSPHVTLGGAYALVLIPTMVLVICAGFIEAFVALGEGAHDWRNATAKTTPLMWEVRSVITEDSDDVEIRVCRGEYHRPIGTADPIDELEAYHALLAKGQEVAGTLNTLGVETVSTALVTQ